MTSTHPGSPERFDTGLDAFVKVLMVTQESSRAKLICFDTGFQRIFMCQYLKPHRRILIHHSSRPFQNPLPPLRDSLNNSGRDDTKS